MGMSFLFLMISIVCVTIINKLKLEMETMVNKYKDVAAVNADIDYAIDSIIDSVMSSVIDSADKYGILPEILIKCLDVPSVRVSSKESDPVKKIANALFAQIEAGSDAGSMVHEESESKKEAQADTIVQQPVYQQIPTDLEQTLVELGFHTATSAADLHKWLLERVYITNNPRPEFLKFVLWSINSAFAPHSAFKDIPATNLDEELVWMSAVILNAAYDANKRDLVLLAISNACKSFGIRYEASVV